MKVLCPQPLKAELAKGRVSSFTHWNNKVRQTNSVVWEKVLNTLMGNSVGVQKGLAHHLVIIGNTCLLGIAKVVLPHLVAVLWIKFIADLINLGGKFPILGPRRAALAKPAKTLVKFTVFPSSGVGIMRIRSGNERNVELLVHLDHIAV